MKTEVATASHSLPRPAATCRGLPRPAAACRVLPRPSSRAWIWDDPAFCTRRELLAPLSCYFGALANPGVARSDDDDGGDGAGPVRATPTAPPAFSPMPMASFSGQSDGVHGLDAPVAFMLENLQPKVVDRARKAARVIFGRAGAPKDLITVHIRRERRAIHVPGAFTRRLACGGSAVSPGLPSVHNS